MPHVWKLVENQWTPVALAGDAFALAGAQPASSSGAMLRRAGAEDAGWALLTPPSVSARVNGEPVALGIRALCDRDEIQTPDEAPVFFSTEKLVAVEPYTGPAGGKCPRCTKEIEPGSPAVRCGSCGTWYHQSEARACFTYGENPICVSCASDAVVSGEFSWTPEEV